MDTNQTYDSLGPGFEPESEKGKKDSGLDSGVSHSRTYFDGFFHDSFSKGFSGISDLQGSETANGKW